MHGTGTLHIAAIVHADRTVAKVYHAELYQFSLIIPNLLGKGVHASKPLMGPIDHRRCLTIACSVAITFELAFDICFLVHLLTWCQHCQPIPVHDRINGISDEFNWKITTLMFCNQWYIIENPGDCIW